MKKRNFKASPPPQWYPSVDTLGNKAASLARIRGNASHPVTWCRFRPSLVMEGKTRFCPGWKSVRKEDMLFRFRELCKGAGKNNELGGRVRLQEGFPRVCGQPMLYNRC